jgi:hypothetical protein
VGIVHRLQVSRVCNDARYSTEIPGIDPEVNVGAVLIELELASSDADISHFRKVPRNLCEILLCFWSGSAECRGE